jgi:NAD(P)-dependent dehydrogenase (short-subunit alcohol dehydrogenase family)
VSDVAINPASCQLLFLDDLGFGEQLAQRLAERGLDVVQVRAGRQFARISESEYLIPPGEAESYNVLLDELWKQKRRPTTITHLWNVTTDHVARPDHDSPDYLNLGFYSLLFLAQALDKHTSDSIQLNVVTNQVYAVKGSETLCPEKSTVLGPCAVIPQELANLTCRSIDIETAGRGSLQEQRVINQLMEITLARPDNQALALRDNQRWGKTFEQVNLRTAVSDAALRENGVYLITGGVGGIGLVLAEHLVRSVRARLVLTTRSPLPPRTEWQQWLSEHQGGDPVRSKLEKLLALEELGAEMEVVCADVGNSAEMQHVVRLARARFGAIHGVIHAAGVAGSGLIQLKTPEMAATVLHPKVKGTLVLDEVLQDESLDFMLLCSSVSAELGGFGEIDYCAANAFLDAYAQHRTSQGRPTTSVNWDVWRDVGLAINSDLPQELRRRREQTIESGILNDEGIEAFRRIISTGLAQVVVSPRDFRRDFELHTKVKVSDMLAALQSDRLTQVTHTRPRLSSEYEPATNDLETAILDLWEELLGVKGIGIYDNFFELGGHSLLGTMLMTRLRKMFRMELALRTLFESPTVAELALAIEESLIQEIAEHREDEYPQLV